MALYGKQLAKQISDSTTGNQARRMFGAMADALANAYATLDSYKWDSALQAMVVPGGAAIYGLTPDAVTPAREYLDSTNAMIEGYYGNMFEDDAELTSALLDQLRTSVSVSSTAVKTVDDLYGTSMLSDLCDSIVDAAGTVVAKVANGVSKLAGSFIGGTWWIWALIGAGAFVWYKWVRKAVAA